MYTRKKAVSLAAIVVCLSNGFIVTRAQLSEGRSCITSEQTSGVCAKASDCEWWMEKIQNMQYPSQSDRCGFEGLDVIVCCPEQQRQPNYEHTDDPIILPGNNDSLSEGKTCTMETDGGPGLCTAIGNCEYRIEQVRQGNRFNSDAGRCSFEGSKEIVCCPTNQHLVPTDVPQAGVRAAERACLEYQAMVLGQDGYDVNPTIIGGESVQPGEFPFMVALGYQKNPQDPFTISYICGGSLITDRHVLTAAHCVLNINNYRPIEVRLGSVSLVDNSNDVQRVPISNIVIHPSYRMSINYFDIAIITMSRPVIVTTKIMPICLQTHPVSSVDYFLREKIIVTGWGVTDFNDDTPSNDLRKTRNLTLIDQQTCAAQYRASNRLPNGVDDSLICILDENPVNRSDACQGDSGGPLFLNSRVVSSLFGIVSFGQSCASSVPGIYTCVYSHLDWIEQNVWPDWLV